MHPTLLVLETCWLHLKCCFLSTSSSVTSSFFFGFSSYNCSIYFCCCFLKNKSRTMRKLTETIWDFKSEGWGWWRVRSRKNKRGKKRTHILCGSSDNMESVIRGLYVHPLKKKDGRVCQQTFTTMLSFSLKSRLFCGWCFMYLMFLCWVCRFAYPMTSIIGLIPHWHPHPHFSEGYIQGHHKNNKITISI